jgi:hypothetical protein
VLARLRTDVEGRHIDPTRQRAVVTVQDSCSQVRTGLVVIVGRGRL